MESSRVEDLKKKFECLQNQSTTKSDVNKTVINYNKNCDNKLSVGPSSKSNHDPNVKLSNSSNFVGRGNIKRSHAFRADKPIVRNFISAGNDMPSSTSCDMIKENISDFQKNHLRSNVLHNGSSELKTNKTFYDLKQKTQPSKRKDFKFDNFQNYKELSVGEESVLSGLPSPSRQKLLQHDIKDKVRFGDQFDPQPDLSKPTYLTVIKSHKTKLKNEQEPLLNSSNSLNLCDTSANIKNINLDNDSKLRIAEGAPTVKSFVKSVEQRNSRKQSSDKLISPKSSEFSNVDKKDGCLSNTLKAALSAPLPSGPPPKKPPRTFAHSSSCENDDTVIKKQSISKTHSGSSVKHNDLVVTNKPVRSKTESQIMLKKLENYLINHQQNSLKMNDNKIVKSSQSCDGSNDCKNTPNMERKLSTFFRSGNKNDDSSANNMSCNKNVFSLSLSRLGVSNGQSDSDTNCFNSLNCTKQPIYESPTNKKSNFFVAIPNQFSVDCIDSGNIGKPDVELKKSSYGTIKRSASEEHIYAEPESFEDCVINGSSKSSATKFKCATMNERRGKLVGFNSRPSLLSPSVTNVDKVTNVQLLRSNFELPDSSKELTDQEKGAFQYGLHYMCTPINDSSRFSNKNNDICSNSFTPILNTSGDFINEAVNTSIRLNSSSHFTSINNKSDTVPCDNLSSDKLLSLSLVSDCTQPRRIRMTSASSGVDVTVADIDKNRIHQLLSEAYGKIKRGNQSNAMLPSATNAGSSADIASGSDSDCSSVISSPDDPNQSFVLPTSSAVANSAALSIRSSKDREKITAERKGYVRRVSRRVTSIRQSPNLNPERFSHLFECLILVGLDLNSARCKVPYIKSKFPENISSPQGIESLCFPDAEDWPPEPDSGQSYIQILTDSNGVRKYSYCRRVQPEDAVICLPLVYCVITPFKSNAFYDKILVDLESRHGHQSDVELSKLIEQFYNSNFPAPGQTFSIQQQIDSNESILIDVYKKPLDLREEDTELAKLLTIIKLSIFLQIFVTLLHERKVILVSDSISKLSICIEGLQSALYPFYWQHTVVPVLPSNLMDICEAPTPYLIGIIKPKLSDLPLNNEDLDLVIDIDKDTVLNCKGDEGWILPTKLSRGLRSALQLSIQASHSNMSAANILASEAIMRLFVGVIGHYRDHIISSSSDSKKREFQRESFVQNGGSRSIQLFLEWFTETAMFNAFIESRLERSSESRGIFEQRCSEYIEENEMNHPLMKKAINKTVKSLGDRFKDWAALS